MEPFWSLAEIWERNKPVLRAIVRHILYDNSLVDDVLQDAFARVLAKGPEFECEQEAYNYSRKTVVNTAISHLRRVQRENALLQPARNLPDNPENRTPLALMIMAEKDSTHQEIEVARSRLRPELQQALDLIFDRRDGRNLKDICRDAGIAYSTLRSRALVAVDEIRRHLRSRGLWRPGEGAGSDQQKRRRREARIRKEETDH